MAAEETFDLARFFTDHMVVQRSRPIRVWGRGVPGQRVEVSLGETQASGVVEPGGGFRVELDAMAAGGPHELVARSGGQIVCCRDVLVGEVWLCSGQSNMRWRLRQCQDADPAVTGSTHRNVRLLDLIGIGHPGTRPWSVETLRDCHPERYFKPAEWQVCNPDAAATFSAVSYFFGVELQRSLGVPVGLIHTSVGGAGMKAHLMRPGTALAGHEWLDDGEVSEWCRQRARRNLRDWLRNPEAPTPLHPFQPSFLFEAAVRPMAPMSIAGVVWYQGESNATLADHVTAVPAARSRADFTELIIDWREAFQRSDLPFVYAQLPGFERPWMEFRQAQLECSDIPGTGMAVTIDLGHPTNEHPGQKHEVGRRLSLQARVRAYGEEVPCDGPRLRSATTIGARIELDFDSNPPLSCKDRRPLRGFEILAAPETWREAAATLERNRIVIPVSESREPSAVRYAWAPHPDGNLTDSSGLPTSPFHAELVRGSW